MDALAALKMLGAVMKDVGAFENRQDVTVEIPESTTTADLSEYGLGTVQVVEKGLTLVVTKTN